MALNFTGMVRRHRAFLANNQTGDDRCSRLREMTPPAKRAPFLTIEAAIKEHRTSESRLWKTSECNSMPLIQWSRETETLDSVLCLDDQLSPWHLIRLIACASCRTSKMSHDPRRRGSCSMTIWILLLHFESKYDSTSRDGEGRWLWRLVGLRNRETTAEMKSETSLEDHRPSGSSSKLVTQS
jgi:hypothetical protein